MPIFPNTNKSKISRKLTGIRQHYFWNYPKTRTGILVLAIYPFLKSSDCTRRTARSKPAMNFSKTFHRNGQNQLSGRTQGGDQHRKFRGFHLHVKKDFGVDETDFKRGWKQKNKI